MNFIPAKGHVEIRPIKNEGLAPISEEKYEEMGEVIALCKGEAGLDCNQYMGISIGDTIFFDSYACRATPEIEGQKHYFVNVIDGGLLAIVKNNVAGE